MIWLNERPVTVHADVRPATEAESGREARRDREHRRCGTANVFCAVEPKEGSRPKILTLDLLQLLGAGHCRRFTKFHGPHA